MAAIKLYKWTVFLVILSLQACIKDQAIKKPYAGYTPIANNDAWEISTPQLENIDE